MKQTIVSSTLILGLSGCAAVSDLPSGYALSPQADEGLAVVSLTVSGIDLERVSSFAYRLREAVGPGEDVKRRPYFHSGRQHARWLQDKDAQGPAASRVTVLVKDQALAEPLDVLESGRPVGRVAALRLPPGDYELYDWKVVVPNQYGGNEFSPRRGFNYRFRIEAGHPVYLGSLNLAMTEQDTYHMSVENKAERDLALLEKKVPAIRAEIIYRPGEMRP